MHLLEGMEHGTLRYTPGLSEVVGRGSAFLGNGRLLAGEGESEDVCASPCSCVCLYIYAEGGVAR